MNIRLIAICILVCAFSSCGIYHPQLAEVPLIDHKGDIRFSTKITSPFILNTTLTTGITNHIALQLHTDVYAPDFPIHYSHFAFGYYQPFGASVLEGYAGIGFNFGNISAFGHTFKSSGWSRIPFLQMNYGWKDLTKAHIDIGASIKAGVIFPNMSYYDNENGNQIQTHSAAGVIEPQVFFRIGSEKIKYSIQTGWCQSVLRREPTNWLYPFTIGMGLTMFLN